MGQYFERMHSLSDNKELPSRIRFMIMDVIELRKNKVDHHFETWIKIMISCFES